MAQATIDRDRSTIAKLQASLEGTVAERDKATAAAVLAASYRDQLTNAFTSLRQQATKLQELAIAHEQRATATEALRVSWCWPRRMQTIHRPALPKQMSVDVSTIPSPSEGRSHAISCARSRIELRNTESHRSRRHDFVGCDRRLTMRVTSRSMISL